MLAALVIVFREVLEAGLIVGVVLAASRGVPGRGRAVFLGILVVAGTAQNGGCLPWKEKVVVGGNGPFSEDRGTKLCK